MTAPGAAADTLAAMEPVHPLLVTPRLALRRFRADDLEFLCRLNADPDVTRHTGGTKDRAQTEQMLRVRVIDYYEANPGLGIWATIERETGHCVGLHLLNHIQGETLIQVGYQLVPQAWGKGYATEMAVAVVRYAFKVMALPRIVAITDLPNVASQRVLLKAGLHRNGEREFAHPAYAPQGPLAWFERDAGEWLAAFGAPA
ncbi:MAG: GNAT family N-acetyltransferase [Xanthomonadales bacterium]|nr:GNAT family N-acetyltransferase [Xanthomonadales bacterium]